ncbi:hypothetical protein [Roseobacter phage RDJL3]|nr:hypothetical protein [Roseobacter phage RDJL3]
MTKTIDEQLERLASAQERSATALEGILEAVTNFKFEQVGSIAVAGVSIPEEDDAGTNDEAATEETAVEETEVEEAQEEDAAGEPEPEPEDAGDAEEPAEDEASSEDSDEGDPLGDGDASEPYALPEKLTNDTLRGFARDLMEKEGKAAVFEVLADVGTGYKAVGEVSKDDLKEAHEKMAERLKG